jgi:hypothetical protein
MLTQIPTQAAILRPNLKLENSQTPVLAQGLAVSPLFGRLHQPVAHVNSLPRPREGPRDGLPGGAAGFGDDAAGLSQPLPSSSLIVGVVAQLVHLYRVKILTLADNVGRKKTVE